MNIRELTQSVMLSPKLASYKGNVPVTIILVSVIFHFFIHELIYIMDVGDSQATSFRLACGR